MSNIVLIIDGIEVYNSAPALASSAPPTKLSGEIVGNTVEYVNDPEEGKTYYYIYKFDDEKPVYKKGKLQKKIKDNVGYMGEYSYKYKIEGVDDLVNMLFQQKSGGGKRRTKKRLPNI